eukprot:m.14042 g.14042  ORF g.14042 m.14042 type:complete len:511 (-) comp4740_c0_seq1:2211-3743(-)
MSAPPTDGDNGASASGTAAKVGFQLSGGARRRKGGAPQPTSGLFKEDVAKDETDFITAVSGSSIKSSKPKEAPKAKVIPLLAVNQWRHPENTSADGAGPAELAGTTPDLPPDSSGAITAESNGGAAQEHGTLEDRAIAALKQDAVELELGIEKEAKVVPLLMQNRVPGYDEAKDDKERYLVDISLRPDEAPAEAYEEMPIDDFGKAALLGMGWKEGEAIGGTNKGLAQPIVGVPRLQRLGLGATRDTELQPGSRKPKKYVKPGESRDAGKKQMEVAPGADGRIRHMRGLDEQLVEKEIPKMRIGAYVVLRAGPHSGMSGKVRVIRSDRIEVELTLGAQIVGTREEDVNLLTRAEYKALKKLGREQPKRDARSQDDGRGHGEPRKKKRETSWLERNIRVRIISDTYKRGKFYNKKVRVVDVTAPTRCNCLDDSGVLLEDLNQSELETIIPKKEGGVVTIVLGEFKGRRGKILEKDKKRSKLVVQLMGDAEVLTFTYDEVSEFLGEDDDSFF